MLKIHPISALVVHTLRRPPKARVFSIALTIFVFASFLFQWRDILAIRRATPVWAYESWGVMSLYLQTRLFYRNPAGIIVVVFSWLILLVLMVKAWYRPTDFSGAMPDATFAEMFAIFGGVYIFCYAFGLQLELQADVPAANDSIGD